MAPRWQSFSLESPSSILAPSNQECFQVVLGLEWSTKTIRVFSVVAAAAGEISDDAAVAPVWSKFDLFTFTRTRTKKMRGRVESHSTVHHSSPQSDNTQSVAPQTNRKLSLSAPANRLRCCEEIKLVHSNIIERGVFFPSYFQMLSMDSSQDGFEIILGNLGNSFCKGKQNLVSWELCLHQIFNKWYSSGEGDLVFAFLNVSLFPPIILNPLLENWGLHGRQGAIWIHQTDLQTIIIINGELQQEGRSLVPTGHHVALHLCREEG